MAVKRVGKVKYTEYQKKKHVSQMSQNEKDYLFNWFAESWANNPRLTIGSHALEMMEKHKRPYASSLAYESVQNFHECLIEYSFKDYYGATGSHRVTLRSKNVYKYKKRWCQQTVVIDLDTMEVVTFFPSHIHDKHETLDLSRYDDSIQIGE